MRKVASSILLTRSIEENAKTKDALQGVPLEILECPLISYQLLSVDWTRLNSCDYIIITSKFLAQHFPINIYSKLKVLVVGEVSASILEEKKYIIELCVENAEQIKTHLEAQEILRASKIIYFCGDNISTPMPNFVEQYEVYKVDYTHDLTHEQIASFQSPLSYIMLYSENSAKTLLQLILKYNLQSYLNDTIIICISDKVSKIFNHLCDQIVIRSTNAQMISYVKENI
jgi:uroporphyrinogen-III synthase